MTRSPFALLSVVALLGGGFAAARAGDPKPAGTARPAAREVRPVEGEIGVCPELLKSGTDVETRLTAGVATPGDVTVRAARLEGKGGLGQVVLRSGARVGALNLTAKTANTAVAAVVTASGPQAGGLEVEQVSRGADGPHRGWAGLRCEAPAADTWFLGAVTKVNNDAQLVLVNPYDDPALVRVELYGKNGLLDVPELDGVVLPPRSRITRELAHIVPDEPNLAIHVVAREGRVAPAVRVSRLQGSTPLGVDWLPRLAQPSSQIDVPGIPTGNGMRRLFLFAPGEDAAHVRIQFTFQDGQFVPDGYDELDVPGGMPTSFDLTPVLTVIDQRTAQKSMKPVALRIFAEGAPVFATAMFDGHARYLPIREMAYVGQAGPITGPTLVSEARNTSEMDCVLLLSAPDGTARVRIETLVHEGPRPGTVVSKTVTVPAGRLVIYPYRALPADTLQAVVITPLDGARVFATRVVSERGKRGPLFTATALVTQPTAGYDVPEVVADPSAALPNLSRD